MMIINVGIVFLVGICHQLAQSLDESRGGGLFGSLGARSGLTTTQRPPSNKMKLSIAIMLPQDYIRLRNFNVCINKEMNRINKGNWSFTNSFYLESYVIIIQKNFKDIEDTICTLLSTQSNTAIYINYNDNSKIEALNSRLFMRLASYINIPVMSFIPNAYATNRPRKNEIQLAPTMYHQAEALMHLLARYDWYKFSVIISDNSGWNEFLRSLEYFETSLGIKQFQILSVVKLKLRKNRTLDKPEAISRLKLLATETRVILLHCHIDETNTIFEAAAELGLMTYEHMWLFTKNVIEIQLYNNYRYTHFPIGSLAIWSNNSADALCDTIIHDSMTLWAHGIENYYESAKNKGNLGLILPHTKCWNSSDVGLDNIKYHYGRNLHDFILRSSIDKGQKGVLKFNQTGILDSVEFKILNLNHKYEWKQVGSWNNKLISIDDLVWPGKQHKPPTGLPNKFHLKIVTLQEPPFVIYKELSNEGNCSANSILVRIQSDQNTTLNKSNPNHYKCASGFYVDLIIELSHKLQFTYDVYEVEDKAWGGKSKNGEWNGLMRDLITNKADLAMTSLKVTTERVEYVDFSVPFMETGIAIVVTSRPGTISTTAFLKPYDHVIWTMLLLVTLHSVAISIYLFEWLKDKFSNRYNKARQKYHFEYIYNVDHPVLKRVIGKQKLNLENNGVLMRPFTLIKLKDKQKFTFGKSLWLVWVQLFRAATVVKHPTGFASKFMANIWAVLCLAFTASYTANLAAFMIIRENFPNLRGIDDPQLTNPYSNNPPFRFTTVQSGSTEEIIKKNYPIMYEYMKHLMVKNVSHGIELVKKKQLDAFLYDAVILDYLAGQDEGCKLRIVGSWYAMTGYGIALPKRSKYKEMINRKILEYSYFGDLERTRRFWFSGTCSKQVDEIGIKSSNQFGLLQSSSVFFMLVAGIILVFTIHFFKFLFNKYLGDKLYPLWFYGNTREMSEEERFKKLERITNLMKPSGDSTRFHQGNKAITSRSKDCDDAKCRSEIKRLQEELDYTKLMLKNATSPALTNTIDSYPLIAVQPVTLASLKCNCPVPPLLNTERPNLVRFVNPAINTSPVFINISHFPASPRSSGSHSFDNLTRVSRSSEFSRHSYASGIRLNRTSNMKRAGLSEMSMSRFKVETPL